MEDFNLAGGVELSFALDLLEHDISSLWLWLRCLTVVGVCGRIWALLIVGGARLLWLIFLVVCGGWFWLITVGGIKWVCDFPGGVSVGLIGGLWVTTIFHKRIFQQNPATDKID